MAVYEVPKESILDTLSKYGEPAGFILRRNKKRSAESKLPPKLREVLLVELEVGSLKYVLLDNFEKIR